MSTPDDNDKNEVSEEVEGTEATVDDANATETAEEVVEQQAEKKEEDTSFALPILFFIIGIAASLIIGWFVFPELLYCKKQQPIDFNHALHNELVDNGCQSCHFFREDGSFAGVPKLEQCIECHTDIQGDSKDEAVFVEKYVSTDTEVPWFVYSRQPDCVFFSHAAHVQLAEMECATCHGNIGESESLPIYERNWLSSYSRDIWGKNAMNMLTMKKDTWERMKMNDCAECHMEKTGRKTSVQTAKDGCFVCHK